MLRDILRRNKTERKGGGKYVETDEFEEHVEEEREARHDIERRLAALEAEHGLQDVPRVELKEVIGG